MNVGVVDLAILLAYLGGVMTLGLWIGRRVRSLSEFMVGGRDLPWVVILASIVATETSTVTFLSIPGFAYERDFTWLQIPLGFLLGHFAVGWLLLPRYFRGEYYTAYEVLHERFGGLTQRAASLLFIVTRSLADGLRLFLTAIVLQEMTGLALPWAVAAIGIATIVYTYVGGIRAVIWTDLLQLAVYVGGALLALWLIVDRIPGGWGEMIERADAAGKLRTFDLSLDWAEPYGLWAGLVGGIFITLGSHGVDQMMVQRYLCARGPAAARKAVWLSGVFIVAQFALFLTIGVALWAYFGLYPPEVPIDRADRVFARFIVAEMPVGVLGVLLGGVFAAAMSTLSSSLNSCATALANDFWRPLAGRRATDERELVVTRVATVVFGLVQIAVGIGGQWLGAPVVAAVLGIAAFTTGSVLGVFFLGLYAPRVGQREALAGLMTGLAVMTWVFFATDVAWPWYALIGSTVTWAAGVAASRLPLSRSGGGERA